METRILVTQVLATRILVTRILATKPLFTVSKIIAALTILISVIGQPALANDRQVIRFYKANKDGITQALRFTASKARKPGCHNLIRKTRLYSTVHFGYKVCHVYAKKGCDAESIMSFHIEKEPEAHTTDLTQGFSWYPVGDHKRGERVKSWHCE